MCRWWARWWQRGLCHLRCLAPGRSWSGLQSGTNGLGGPVWKEKGPKMGFRMVPKSYSFFFLHLSDLKALFLLQTSQRLQVNCQDKHIALQSFESYVLVIHLQQVFWSAVHRANLTCMPGGAKLPMSKQAALYSTRGTAP